MTTDGRSMPQLTNHPTTPRKTFNCFVDDTALIAGLKKSTRDGIKKWVNNQSIQVFVPLHTLERLRYLARQTDRPGRVSTDAHEAIEWLDKITSDSENPTSQLVHLEGGFEVYDTWAEVEKYLLPQTLLSMESEQAEDVMHESLADLRLDALPDNASVSSQESTGARTSSPISVYSATSPVLASASPFREAKTLKPIGTGRPSHKKTNSNVSNTSAESSTLKKPVVPKSLQPYFNHLLWRMNQDSNTNAVESYILVTNDQFKQQVGQRFGIRCKRLEQLRDVIAREERDLRNREQVLKKENQANEMVNENKAPTIAEEIEKAHIEDDDDDDIVVFKRPLPKAPQAMIGSVSSSGNGKQVVDPNSFGGRTSQIITRGGRGAYRGNRVGTPARVGHLPRTVTPVSSPRQPPIDLSKPIDPNSYSRSSPAARVVRGGRRQLWEPT